MEKTRLGNFVVSEIEDKSIIEVRNITGDWGIRLSRFMAQSQFLLKMMDEDMRAAEVLVTMWFAATTITDARFVRDVYELAGRFIDDAVALEADKDDNDEADGDTLMSTLM